MKKHGAFWDQKHNVKAIAKMELAFWVTICRGYSDGGGNKCCI